MTRKERNSEIKKTVEEMYALFLDLVSYKDRLEGIGCKAEAKKLDTVVGKLENICLTLTDKSRE